MAEQGPSTQDTTQRHRYRVFLIWESVFLVFTILACVGALGAHMAGAWVGLVFGILCMWHVVAIPICFFYLIGRPVVMTLDIDSAESRAFRRELSERTVLSDSEFHARYYEGADHLRGTSARLRHSLRAIDPLFERAIPTDHLYLLYDELDFEEILKDTEKEFGIRFSEEDTNSVDGTLDNLIRLVHRRIASETS